MRLDDFRIFYNHTIHPELVRMERERRRLLRLLMLSGVVGLAVVGVLAYIDLFSLSIAFMLPLGAYMVYLLYRIRRFVLRFKPRVINLVLDFIDDGLNIGTLSYEPSGTISRERFLASRIFETEAPYFKGEDLIRGSVGEMTFEMSELRVREPSPVRGKLQNVFSGVFMHATFPEFVRGEMVVWPRRDRQHLMRSIKSFTRDGADNMEDEILNVDFREAFIVFAMPGTHVNGILTDPMQSAILRYRQLTGKEICLSFVNRKIYVSISNQDDLLEPRVFRSNLSFELVRTFFEDIHLLLEIVEVFDQTH